MNGKMYTRGLVVGKFCPLHYGHMLVVDSALAQCDEVFLLSYTKPQFDHCGKAVREEWLRALYPQEQALVLEDSVDFDLPHNDATDAQQREFVGWVCERLFCTEVDAVFTSEDYGDGFAAALGAFFIQRGRAPGNAVQHVCVDKARDRVPTSGTAIRADPYASRHLLPPLVYASFVRSVAVLGGDSSGKTSLARGLAEALGTAWAPEYGREYWVAKSGALEYEDLLHIAKVQIAREDALVAEANRFLLCDTSPLTTLGYSMAMFDRADPELEQLAGRPYDTILLCAPDFPFVQDGTRRDTDFRAMQHQMYRNVPEKKRIAYTVLAGPLERRLQHAITLLT